MCTSSTVNGGPRVGSSANGCMLRRGPAFVLMIDTKVVIVVDVFCNGIAGGDKNVGLKEKDERDLCCLCFNEERRYRHRGGVFLARNNLAGNRKPLS